MIKINCDNCGKPMGYIIDTPLYICSTCLNGKDERGIYEMLTKIKTGKGLMQIPPIDFDDCYNETIN